ncbi:MAG: InlB B-repeat-containing protein, partial [Treponema sp.]|nr:InlB B-repeat-containing protein [Treponema sp.]
MGGVACQPEAPVGPTKYTISFDSGVESITVEEGTVATEPTTAPEKTGYTFGGWLNGEAAYDWTQPVTSNLSLTAKWTPTQYTITYLPKGVEKDTYIKSYTIESNAIVLDTNPTSPDATTPNFVAWHVDSEEGAVVTEIAKGSTGNKTFYAEFSAEEPCVVKFMSGTTEVASTKVKKGNKITLPNGFEKYSLFSDADCTKPFDTNTAITADTTIYVEIKTFTISYKVLPFDKVNPVEGETNGSMSVEYGKVFTDEEINALAEEIDGYTYKGVFTDEACTVPFDNTKAITSNLTVYVLYEESINPVLWEGETTLAWTDEGEINFETPDWISANQWVLISYELT